MTSLRCWARRESDGAQCVDAANHIDSRHLWGVERVGDSCAPDAGPDGGETAAERLLEVAHIIDRLSFRRGEHSEFPARLRAIASRLRIGTDAARKDLAEIESDVEDGRGLRAMVDAHRAENADLCAWVEATERHLSLAADILRHFAEGR